MPKDTGKAKIRILANRYKVERKLGSGSFGVVHLVHDLKSKEEELKVLKEIPVGDLQPDETVGAVREARLLSKLDHPGIVRFHDSFIDGEHFCIVTEYCEGGDLDDKIHAWKKAGKSFDESLILTWLTQLLLAVQYMHQRRVLHRDLKTRNIFLKSNMIKIGDFGISRILMGTTDIATTFTGTPYYMSPEVLRHEGYNSKSDIWSLGVILYELCSLKRAFQGQNLMGVMFRIVEGEPPTLPKKYHEDLASIYKCMLTKDPQKRPSAAEVLSKPLISDHMAKLRDKMSSRMPNVKDARRDAKELANYLSTSAKKGHLSTVVNREAEEDERPRTAMERLKIRKQQKADEEAAKLRKITAQSYEESRIRYSETKQRQNKVSVSLPWVEEHPDVFDDPVFSESVSKDLHSDLKEDKNDTDPIESDPVDLTSVSEIPEDEELAETFYSQVDEFEEDSNSSESDFEDEDDEYNAFVQCLGDALDMTGTQSATNSELNSSQDDRGITPSMRNHKIESLRQECIRLLGANDFRKAYEYLKRVRFEDEGYVSEDSIMDGLKKLVGKPRDCFLVDQLIFLEKQEEISKQSFGE